LKIQQGETLVVQSKEDEDEGEGEVEGDPPEGVRVNSESPPLRRIRASKADKIMYGFVDASKGGFG
jgi:hypothetical protein